MERKLIHRLITGNWHDGTQHMIQTAWLDGYPIIMANKQLGQRYGLNPETTTKVQWLVS